MSNSIRKHPWFSSAVVIALVTIAVLVPFQLAKAKGSSATASLVLVPKAELAAEPAAWTFAPEVPPPITRHEQRRVVVNWSIREMQAEIAPGVIYDDYWAFEGKVPGPVLRVRQGDLIELHLTNHITSMNSHNIDFHFVYGPGGAASVLNTAPGGTSVVEIRAMVPGFYMYHCASPDIPTHISNGMYGFVIVEPEAGLPAVDKEFYVVQSEIYTRDGAQGHQSFSIERGEKSDPQYVVFNGAQGSLLGDNSPHVKVGDKVRVWFGDAGPNLISSFHIIGTIFENVYREGDIISPPAHGIQTTLVPAGGSTVVEFTPQVPGKYLLVDHAIFRLHKGAAGAIVADGAANPEVFNPITANASAADAHDKAMAAGMSHGETPGGGMAANQAMPMNHGGMMMNHPMMAAAAQMPIVVAAAGDVPPPVLSISAQNLSQDDVQQMQRAQEAQQAQEAPAEQTGPSAEIRILEGAGNYGAVNTYSPKVLTIRRGTTVTWMNTDAITHNVRGEGGLFDSSRLDASQSFSMKFDKVGTYQYFCAPHPWMKGTIIVK